MTERIRAFVVDDEEPGRTRVLELLRRDEEVEVVGTASDGQQAIAALGDRQVDLLFLDIQMPLVDGFGVLRALPHDAAPVTIFVTAFDQFAIEAFEVHALDYLLKPFSDERFEDALRRAKQLIRNQEGDTVQLRLANLLSASTGEKSYLNKLILRNGGRVTFLDVKDIDWIEAQGVYILLHVGSTQTLYRSTLGQIQQKLDPNRFVRISRSATINVDCIRELQQQAGGNYLVVLRDGTKLALTKNYRPELEQWLKQSL